MTDTTNNDPQIRKGTINSENTVYKNLRVESTTGIIKMNSEISAVIESVDHNDASNVFSNQGTNQVPEEQIRTVNLENDKILDLDNHYKPSEDSPSLQQFEKTDSAGALKDQNEDEESRVPTVLADNEISQMIKQVSSDVNSIAINPSFKQSAAMPLITEDPMRGTDATQQ